MSTVTAAITVSLDGYVTGPDDGPDMGLGAGGERLHYWVFGAPWSYGTGPKGEPTGVDKEVLDEALSRVGAVIGGRTTFEAADRWGGHNPFGVPMFVLTHEPPEVDPDSGFTFVDNIYDALDLARNAAGEKDVSVMGGADVIRQMLRAGRVDELYITIAPVTLGGGKRLFEGFHESLDLEQLGVRQSQFATHLSYRVHH